MFAVEQITAEIEARGWASCRVWTTGNRTIFVEWPHFEAEKPLQHAVILPQGAFDPAAAVDELQEMAERDGLDPMTGQKAAELSLDLPEPSDIQS